MPKFDNMMVMSKKLWGLILGLSVLFILFSCSNPQAAGIKTSENTLRNELSQKSQNTVWTRDIEGERLNEKLNQFINIADKNLMSPQLVQSIKGVTAPVYPQIKELASLDTSTMNSILLNTIKEFCNALKEGTENLSPYFDSEYFFNYVFFKNDLNEVWQTDLKPDEKLFDRFVICSAFEGDELIQVPVRFYKGKEYIDLSVFLSYHGGYKINQIEIIRWGKLNGETEKQQ